jgi:uncharacterized protein (UPF0212 family)
MKLYKVKINQTEKVIYADSEEDAISIAVENATCATCETVKDINCVEDLPKGLTIDDIAITSDFGEISISSVLKNKDDKLYTVKFYTETTVVVLARNVKEAKEIATKNFKSSIEDDLENEEVDLSDVKCFKLNSLKQIPPTWESDYIPYSKRNDNYESIEEILERK